MAWRKPDRADIEATLSQRECEAFLRGTDPSDVVFNRLLERTCDYVRDALRSNGKVRLSPTPYEIPGGCISKAMDYLAVDILKRISLAITPERQRAREDAEAYFAKIASGETTPESHGVAGTVPSGGPAIEVVRDARRRVSPEKLEGL